jgi:hypothetical protein
MAVGGQVAPYGAQATLNHLLHLDVPIIGATAPTSFVAGQYWINTSSTPTPFEYNGTAWVASSGVSLYLTLLAADPTLLPAVLISDLVEITTAGMARQPVTMSADPGGYPGVSTNTGVVTWGPFTADMLQAAKWLALVDVVSGTAGNFRYSWPIPGQQVNTSQVIQLGTDGLTLSQS